MTALFATLLGIGLALLVIAAVWAWRTRHERRLWRQSRHDTTRVAMVLELEDKVRELEALDIREPPALETPPRQNNVHEAGARVPVTRPVVDIR